MKALLGAERVIARDFERTDLFCACQPIEEVARTGHDSIRFGALKPVGLSDPRTGRRPWAAVQLRAENPMRTSYNLVGFQTNLTWPEQRRVFRMKATKVDGIYDADPVSHPDAKKFDTITYKDVLARGLKVMEGDDNPLLAPALGSVTRRGRASVEEVADDIGCTPDEAVSLLDTLCDWASIRQDQGPEGLSRKERDELPLVYETLRRDANLLTEYDRGHAGRRRAASRRRGHLLARLRGAL